MIDDLGAPERFRTPEAALLFNRLVSFTVGWRAANERFGLACVLASEDLGVRLKTLCDARGLLDVATAVQTYIDLVGEHLAAIPPGPTEPSELWSDETAAEIMAAWEKR